jgi:hypothetical protein
MAITLARDAARRRPWGRTYQNIRLARNRLRTSTRPPDQQSAIRIVRGRLNQGVVSGLNGLLPYRVSAVGATKPRREQLATRPMPQRGARPLSDDPMGPCYSATHLTQLSGIRLRFGRVTLVSAITPPPDAETHRRPSYTPCRPLVRFPSRPDVR